MAVGLVGESISTKGKKNLSSEIRHIIHTDRYNLRKENPAPTNTPTQRKTHRQIQPPILITAPLGEEPLAAGGVCEGHRWFMPNLIGMETPPACRGCLTQLPPTKLTAAEKNPLTRLTASQIPKAKTATLIQHKENKNANQRNGGV